MSGSPPLPPRRNPEASDRGHGSYGSGGQGVFQGTQPPPLEQQQHSEHRGPPLRYTPDSGPPAPYSSYRVDTMQPAQLHFQPPPSQLPPQQQTQHHSYQPHPPQPAPFSTPDRPPIREAPEFSSPKQQRKTKGHVASACVPCKRAHLRCDAQRPCSRCLSNGKEDACVDVQHKKRGRPRLRDERESRYEGVGPGYSAPEASMRRPLSFHEGQMVSGFGDPLHRPGSYRVLKSQVGSMPGPIAPRYIDWGNLQDANIYGGSGSMPPTPRMLPSQDPICAYLTTEMQIAKTTPNFGDTIALQPIVGRKLQDILSPNDREKVLQLQRNFEGERREREPNYLPPIYLHKFEEDRAIQSVGFGQEEIGQLRTDHGETFTFPGADGQQRTFNVRLGLAKKDATYFVVLILQVPATPQQYQQPSTSPFSRESHSRESQYGYGYQQPPQQQIYAPSQGPPPYVPNPNYADPRGDMSAYRPPGPLVQNMPPSGNMPSFAPPQSARPEYSQGQTQFQTPRSELAQASQPRQHDLQLPPIRDQGPSMDPMRRRDDRSGRVDIGGLLEKPNPGGSGV
ncbi:hypothetical protein V8E51_014966 [Hyaloscypha variabilis]